MNYLEYYELNQEPFSNAPVSRFYYNSPPHSQALMRLSYAVESMKGLALLIGDIGAGKTTLARRLLDTLSPDRYVAALLVIIHAGITASWVLKRIALQIGVSEPSPDKIELLSQLYDQLLTHHKGGKKVVVLIDEAQMLRSKEIMEEFRGLLNLEVAENKLITFVFFGLPEIEMNLKLDEPLAQRVALKCRLESFHEDTTESYIKHRLKLAGAKRMLFTQEAVKAIHRSAKGIPRLINTLCDNALFEGYIVKAPHIGVRIVENIAIDLGLNPAGVTSAAASPNAISNVTTPRGAVEPSSQPGPPQTQPQPTPQAEPQVPAAPAPMSPPASVAPAEEEEIEIDPIALGGAEEMEEIDNILDTLKEKSDA